MSPNPFSTFTKERPCLPGHKGQRGRAADSGQRTYTERDVGLAHGLLQRHSFPAEHSLGLADNCSLSKGCPPDPAGRAPSLSSEEGAEQTLRAAFLLACFATQSFFGCSVQKVQKMSVFVGLAKDWEHIFDLTKLHFRHGATSQTCERKVATQEMTNERKEKKIVWKKLFCVVK